MRLRPRETGPVRNVQDVGASRSRHRGRESRDWIACRGAGAGRRGARAVGSAERARWVHLAGRHRPARLRQPRPACGARSGCRTHRIELLTTVLNVGYRRNPTVLAKQIASVDQLSTRRLTVGLALGGWPEDYAASEAPLSGRGATFDATLVAMRKVWRGADHTESSAPALATSITDKHSI